MASQQINIQFDHKLFCHLSTDYHVSAQTNGEFTVTLPLQISRVRVQMAVSLIKEPQ